MAKERNIIVCILLSIFTCGIYNLIWMAQITDEMINESKEETQSGGLAVLLTIITCGLYRIYWGYRMGEMAQKAQEKNELVQQNNSVIYLILELFGFSMITNCLIQNDLNMVVRKRQN